MWWLLPVAYIIIFGKRRSPCETPNADMDTPPLKPTTRASIEVELGRTSFITQREFPVVGTPTCPTPWDVGHALLDALLHQWEALRPDLEQLDHGQVG